MLSAYNSMNAKIWYNPLQAFKFISVQQRSPSKEMCHDTDKCTVYLNGSQSIIHEYRRSEVANHTNTSTVPSEGFVGVREHSKIFMKIYWWSQSTCRFPVYEVDICPVPKRSDCVTLIEGLDCSYWQHFLKGMAHNLFLRQAVLVRRDVPQQCLRKCLDMRIQGTNLNAV
jgi:hypothetical protein